MDYFVYVLIITDCFLSKTVLSVGIWPKNALRYSLMTFSTDEMKASYSKCGELQNDIPNLGGHQIPGDSYGKMSSRRKY